MTDKTRNPSKQRKEAKNAALHRKSKRVRSTLSEELREEYDRRRVRVVQGDTVEVMRGDDAGHEAEVAQVHVDTSKLMVEGVVVEATDGEEVPRPVDPSNVRVVELNLEDDIRREEVLGEETDAFSGGEE